MEFTAYLDIETTGLSRRYCELTVIGIAVEQADKLDVIQITGNQINSSALVEALDGVQTVYTYNGSRFDLPFINARLGLDIRKTHKHIDLMYHCWKKNLKGGLKRVERQIGIQRELADINGYMAVKLWRDYVRNGDINALQTLLEYNREDVVNLHVLRRHLGV